MGEAKAADQGQATPSKTDLAIRVEAIARLLLKGWPRRRVIDWVDRQSGWKISARSVDRLIARATVILAKEADRHCDLKAEFALAKSRLEALYSAALDRKIGDDRIPDIRTALFCQRELNKLMGLEAARPEVEKPDEAVTFEVIGTHDL